MTQTQDPGTLGLRDLDIAMFAEALCMADGTDLHLKVGAPPRVRLDGELHPLNVASLEDGDMYRLARETMPPEMWTGFQTGQYGDVDFAHEVSGVGRFRVNCFRQRGTIELVLRRIPDEPPLLDRMGLPEAFAALVHRNAGLVLLTGPARSGKTTTMAAMVAAINRTRRVHVVTVEDPVEYVFTDDVASVSQRSLRSDAGTWDEALAAVLRQDPDVLCIGAIRDGATFDAALHAASAGILVLATLDAGGVIEALERVLGWFPQSQEQRVRRLLARHLLGVLAQRLLSKAGGEGRVAAAELLLGTPEIASVLGEGEIGSLGRLMAVDPDSGMQTLDQALSSLVLQGEVEASSAAAAASDHDDLAALLHPAGIPLP